MPLDPSIADKYDLRVPRYTSYPTAPHFNDSVDGAVYERWLGEIEPTSPLSLYFHIPFCDSMCWFCGCFTRIVNHYEPIRNYLDVLIEEIGTTADALSSRFTVSHLHWGGGSPTLLTGADWMRSVERIRDRFDLTPDAEIAVEMDPRDTTIDYVRALAAAGVNRASIGVQDYHPEVQEAVNRIQPYETTMRVIGWMREHGIKDINMDLMYGLPHQTVDRVTEMVDKTVALAPARIALFGYAHVPWMKPHQKMIPEEILPGARDRWNQAEAAAARLVDHGYVRIGLDHFARSGDSLACALDDGTLHRNFQGYTADSAPVLLGFGASAIGALPQGYVQNTTMLKDYRASVGAGRFAVARGIAFSPEDKLRRAIIERLMCDLSVDLDSERAEHDLRIDLSAEMKALEPLAADGIVRVEGPVVTIPEEARPLVRLVAATFDTYLRRGGKKHSRAV